MRDDKADAAILRHAAWILRERAQKRTFALRVIIRVLELRADRIEHNARPPGAPVVPARDGSPTI